MLDEQCEEYNLLGRIIISLSFFDSLLALKSPQLPFSHETAADRYACILELVSQWKFIDSSSCYTYYYCMYVHAWYVRLGQIISNRLLATYIDDLPLLYPREILML